MTSTQYLNSETLCRICLKDDPACFRIFQNSLNHSLLGRIITCTSLDIQENDGLPQQICCRCRFQIEKFYQFRKRSTSSDYRLRRHKSLLDLGKETDLFEDISANDEEVELVVDEEENAIQKIRNEMVQYKKSIAEKCEADLRVQIEQQIRSDLKAAVFAEAKKQCRHQCLDELFVEMQNFFIYKRNEYMENNEEDISRDCSDTETVDLESTRTRICSDVDLAEFGNNEDISNNVDFVEIIMDDQNQIVGPNEDKAQLNISGPSLSACRTRTDSQVPPMVEICMQNNQSEYLRNCTPNHCVTSLAKTAPSKSVVKATVPNSRHQLKKKSDRYNKTPGKERQIFCRKHMIKSKKSKSSLLIEGAETCYRCRLRGRIPSFVKR